MSDGTSGGTKGSGADVAAVGGVPAYAMAYLRDVRLGADVISYLERIDETLDAYGGRFLVHGGELIAMEGEWDGQVVIIEFPSRQAALDWYASPGYQEILPLRVDNSRSVAAVVDGVPAGYRATRKLSELGERLG